MMKFLFRAVIFTSVFLLGVGCVNQEQPTPVSPADDMVTTLSSGPEGSASSTPVVAEPIQWERTVTPTGITFTPPKGYWVFVVESLYTHYLVPGAPSKPGDADPRVSLAPKAVATFTELQIDPESFSSWDEFEVTMARFACTAGTADADSVTCSDKLLNVTTGKTAGGWLYRKFSLPAKLKSTGASKGVRTFISVRRGEKADIGLLVTVENERTGAVPALELVKSMKGE